MRKFIIVLLGIIFLITPFCYAAWKFNPHTNKMDFYEDVETTSGWTHSGTSIYPTTITDNVGIGNTAPWQELTVSGDITISDDTPNLTFRDSDSNVAWQWHLDTAADGYALWKGTDSGAGFSVTPDTPIIKIDSNNQVKMASQLHILQGTLDLASLYDIDPDVWVLDLHSDAFPNGIYITKIYVDCSVADPTTEIDADLKYCDAVADGAFPGANVVIVTAIDTTTGNFANASLNIAIPTGKTLYITLNADPTDTTTVYHIRIHYRIP